MHRALIVLVLATLPYRALAQCGDPPPTPRYNPIGDALWSWLTPFDAEAAPIPNCYRASDNACMTPAGTPCPSCTPCPGDYAYNADGCPVCAQTFATDWTHATNMVAVWRFDATDAGLTTDSSGSSTLTNTNVTFDATNKIQGAGSALFNGTTAKLTCADATCTALQVTDYITYGAWVRPTSYGSGNAPILDKWNSPSGWHTYHNAGRSDVWTAMGNGTASALVYQGVTGNTVPLNGWSHQTAAWDNGGAQPHVRNWTDGVVTTYAGGLGAPVTSGGTALAYAAVPFQIGGTTAPDFWTGNIDEVWVYHGILSNASVCRIARCRVDGSNCTCDPADPTHYVSTGDAYGVCAGGSNVGGACAVSTQATDCPGSTCTACVLAADGSGVACNAAGPN